MSLDAITTVAEMLSNAEKAEAEQDLETATKLYEKAIKADVLTEHAYNRLMIL